MYFASDARQMRTILIRARHTFYLPGCLFGFVDDYLNVLNGIRFRSQLVGVFAPC